MRLFLIVAIIAGSLASAHTARVNESIRRLVKRDDPCPSASRCTCESGIIKCFDFDSFDELSFHNIDQIDILELRPSEPIQLDKKLNLNNVRINKQVILRNINGFLYNHDPFQNVKMGGGNQSAVELKIFESEFEFYVNAKDRLNNVKCNSLAYSNKTFSTFLSKFSKIWLFDDITYSTGLCQFVFNNANIEIFVAHSLNNTNKLKFNAQPSSSVIDSLSTKVKYLYLFNSRIERLDTTIVDKYVFKDLKTLQVLGHLREIDDDFFENFKSLRSIQFELFNFKSFISQSNKWMAPLRRNLSDIGSNATNEAYLTLQLNDRNQEFTYRDEDICLFKYLPIQFNVYPVLKTKETLLCSCTLIWLTKNWKSYPDKSSGRDGALNIMETKSVRSCIRNDELFLKFLRECEFKKKFDDCGDSVNEIEDDPTTTTDDTTTHTTTTSTTTERLITSTASPVTERLTQAKVQLVSEISDQPNDEVRTKLSRIAAICGALGFFTITIITGAILFFF